MLEKFNSCHLCPRNCGINRNVAKGFCGASNQMKIARFSLHEWEEPCLSGTNGSGTIFFTYCNLQCIFCQNYKISSEHVGREISILEFSDICLKLQKMGAHNINLVTPTHYVPLIVEGIRLARKHGLTLPIIYNTSGYETVETIQMLNGIIDIYLPDFKYFDEKIAKPYSNVSNYTSYVKASLEEMVKQVGKPKYDKNGLLQKGVIVRHLCLPGLEEDSKNILKYLYDTYHNHIIISIMNQYTPVRNIPNFKNLNRTLTEEEYDEIIDYACDIGITNAFIQEGETQKSSFIPDFFDNFDC